MPRSVWLRRALWSVAACGLFIYLALSLWLAFSALFFPYQLDYGEGDVSWFSHELGLGHSIYNGLQGPPYFSSNYPPLAMLLAALLRAVFGGDYIGGRWLNFAATLIVAAFVLSLVRRETRRSPQSLPGGAGHKLEEMWAPLLSALFFLGSTFIYHWIPLFRVDMVAVAFTSAGIFFVWRWEKGEGRKRKVGSGKQEKRALNLIPWDLVLAALFFLCALYSKHSMFFGPAAAALAIFLKDRRTAVLFTLGLGLCGGVLLLALDALTHGGILFGLVTSNATLWLVDTFLRWTRTFLWTYLILIALALWTLVERARARRIGVLELYAVAAFASIGLAGRVGAWENYYFEAIMASCILAGIALASLIRGGQAASIWLPLMLLIQLALFWPEHNPAIAQSLMDAARRGNAEVAPLVRAAAGTVISEDMGLLWTNGKPVEYYTFEYSNLARAGLWDQHWELANLRAGNFPLVILNQGTRQDVDNYRNLTREFVSALDFGYALKLENVRYHVYAPSPLAHLREDNFEGQLQLAGWSLAPEENLRAGETRTLTLVWRAQEKLRARYTAFAHLEDSSGGVVAQDDHEPKVGTDPSTDAYPTPLWAANEMVRDIYILKLPPVLKPGAYVLRVGWYDSVTQDRLTVNGGKDFVELARFEVQSAASEASK